MSDLPESPETDGSSYLMNLSQHQEINDIAFGTDLPAFAGDFSWRRHLVHDLYHALRGQGDSHDDAITGILQALPRLWLDSEGEAFFE